MPVSLHESVVVLGASALTLVPSLLFLALMFRRSLRRAPLPHLLTVFIFSLLTIQPVGFLEGRAWTALSALPLTGLTWFVVDNLAVGMIEESVKFAFLLMLLRGPRRPTPVAHTILYAVTVSLGFAAMENVRYAWNAHQVWGLGAFIGARGLIATPAHMEDGVLMGFLVGQAIIATNQRKRRTFWILSLLLPALSHAFYDYCATLTDEYDVTPALLSTLAMFAAFAQVTAGFFVAAFLIRRSLPRTPRRTPSRASPLSAAIPQLPAPEACPVCSALGPAGRRACRRCGSAGEPLAAEPVA